MLTVPAFQCETVDILRRGLQAFLAADNPKLAPVGEQNKSGGLLRRCGMHTDTSHDMVVRRRVRPGAAGD